MSVGRFLTQIDIGERLDHAINNGFMGAPFLLQKGAPAEADAAQSRISSRSLLSTQAHKFLAAAICISTYERVAPFFRRAHCTHPRR